eukprot:229409_1
MGCCHNTGNGDNSVRQSNENFKDCESEEEKSSIKILVLGTSGSGKTSIIKQIQHINNVYETDGEPTKLSTIIDCVVSDMKILCRQSLFLNYKYEETSVEQTNERFRNEILALKPPYILTRSLALKIQALYKDNGIQETLKHYEYFQISDNAKYFFQKIEEISMNEYEPSFDDCIRIYQQTIGYWQYNFLKYIDDFGEFIFDLSDVSGSQTERKKWLTSKLLLNPNINTIIYIVAISEYNMVLYEDNTTNRLIESINCFEQMIVALINYYGKTDFMKNKSIILLFNKYDIFMEKIQNIPITITFNNFPSNMNPNASNDVVRFIASMFLRILEKYNADLHVPLRIIRTTAINSESVNKMFNSIIPDMINNNLKNENILINEKENKFVAPLMLQKRGSLPIHQHHGQSQLTPSLSYTQSLPVYRKSKVIMSRRF